MKVKINPSQLGGMVTANASKSSMQRACAAALVHPGSTILSNPGNSNDDKAALGIIQALGAVVIPEGEQVLIRHGEGTNQPITMDCGESGLSIRMFTPLAALLSQPVTITGNGSLVNRPMDFFDEVLPRLGVETASNSGKLPLTICGPLRPVNIGIDGSLSSQFLTGLLLAYSASEAENVYIRVRNLKSRPYVNLTLAVMKDFGLRVPEIQANDVFFFGSKPNKEKDGVVNYFVEGDWSGAAFLLVAGAIAGPVTVDGLSLDSTQADKAIYDVLVKAGANVVMDGKKITVHRSVLRAFEFDATDCPDLFPPLVSLASYCQGVSQIQGVSRLAHKESDRAKTLKEEFEKMGVKVDYDQDIMTIKGGQGVTGARVHSRHDHRIAMACAVAALGARGETEIDEAEAVNKSYPDFYRHLMRLGADLEVKPFSFFK